MSLFAAMVKGLVSVVVHNAMYHCPGPAVPGKCPCVFGLSFPDIRATSSFVVAHHEH